MDQQPIQPQSETDPFLLLARRYQQLVDFGERHLSEWRRECDLIDSKHEVRHEARLADAFVESAYRQATDLERSSPVEQLQDATDDLHLIKYQLEQVQEELEFYFFRYREKELECQQKSDEISKLTKQHTWLIEQITKQSVLLTRLMTVLSRLSEQSNASTRSQSSATTDD
jgi:hypothetical protein